LIISELTLSEADYLQAVCNFTPDENELFELRLQGVSLDECAERMHRTLDSVKQLSRKVNKKIKKEI
jgi:DNA-directed RNA polymerase specialized sigma24 family protein